MIKVVFVHRIVSMYREGFYAHLVEEGARRGIDIKIIYSLPSPATARSERSACFIHLPSILSLPITIGGMRHNIVVPRGLYRRLSAERPDVIVAEDISALPAGLIVATYGRLRRCPYLIWGLGSVPGRKMSPLRRVFRPFINYFRFGAEAFLGYGEYAACHYRTVYGRPAFPVYNSTVSRREIRIGKLDLRARYSAKAPLRLLFIGRISPQKKLDRLFEAAHRLMDVDWRLDIIGDGELLAELKRQAAEMDLTERIIFHGAIYDIERKAEILAACHLAVMPGLGGLMIQEAYCHGIPVICGPADGTEQDLVGGINADLLLPEATPDALAYAIGNFSACSVEEKVARALRCVDIVRKTYNVENMTNSILSAVENVAAPRTGVRSVGSGKTSAY